MRGGGYAAAVSATSGGGSFMGLLIIPFALFSIPTLLLALVPPIVILILRGIEG